MQNEIKHFPALVAQMQTYCKLLPNDFILHLLNGEVDVKQLLHAELANRGWSAQKGRWVGSPAASTEYDDRWGDE